MAIHIQTGKNSIDYGLKTSVQSVPFKIHADCDAEIKKYFETYVKTSEEDVLTASFRGYPLRGKKVNIPDSYVGVILHESIRPTTDKDERKFYVVHHFDSIVNWNWDKAPSKNDNLIQALDWITVAEALHSPILEE